MIKARKRNDFDSYASVRDAIRRLGATLICGAFDVEIQSEVYNDDVRRALIDGLRAKIISQPAAT